MSPKQKAWLLTPCDRLSYWCTLELSQGPLSPTHRYQRRPRSLYLVPDSHKGTTTTGGLSSHPCRTHVVTAPGKESTGLPPSGSPTGLLSSRGFGVRGDTRETGKSRRLEVRVLSTGTPSSDREGRGKSKETSVLTDLRSVLKGDRIEEKWTQDPCGLSSTPSVSKDVCVPMGVHFVRRLTRIVYGDWPIPPLSFFHVTPSYYSVRCKCPLTDLLSSP